MIIFCIYTQSEYCACCELYDGNGGLYLGDYHDYGRLGGNKFCVLSSKF